MTKVIAATDHEDTQAVFDAILIASPGGLGSADHHDVHQPAMVTLREAMAQAASRDSIARQWTNGFADVLGCRHGFCLASGLALHRG